jgi:hypothetical protein
MDLVPYVDRLRRELAAAAEAGGEQAQSAAQQLATVLESAVRLTLLEALSAAADEITRDLAPGSVHIRLQGMDPTFVVSSPSGPAFTEGPPTTNEPGPPQSAGAGAGTARINLRLPEDLKTRVEEAANRERLSVNTWLVRAAASALDSSGRRRFGGGGAERFTGWVR